MTADQISGIMGGRDKLLSKLTERVSVDGIKPPVLKRVREDGRLNIRNETESDYKTVEDITRKAFYNVYVPGCVEHYLVHIMREHEDFVRELDFVIEADGQIIGNIMYTKAKLTDEQGREKEILTFGPVSVLPQYQRKGYGKMLIMHSMQRAAQLGFDVVVIMGNPAEYARLGFQCCRRHHVCMEGGKYPSALLVKELKAGSLDGRTWYYSESPVMNIDEQKARAFDDALEQMERKQTPGQEAFYIMSHSFIEP